MTGTPRDRAARKTLVVSAVNLVEGGTLTVLRDCLAAAVASLPDWQVVALVHDAERVGVPGVEYRAFARVKGSWARRLHFEFWTSRALSRALRADVWLCLHDISAASSAPRQAVYCHNPSPFHRASLREGWQDPVFFLFTLLYGRLYGLNIRRNDWVIVQQDWLRAAFIRRYGLPPGAVVVSHPVSPSPPVSRPARPIRVFAYPTLARPFKNVELIGEALRLVEQEPDWTGEVRVTIAPSESRYARWLARRYADVGSLKFIGRQDRAGMRRLYDEADALVFPSRLETWGMPITEAKAAGLPIVAADLPYARETVGTHDRAAFVPVDDPARLAATLLAAVRGENPFAPAAMPDPAAPFTADWPALLTLLTRDQVMHA